MAAGNAGIYEDGGLGTAAEVSKLFASFAKQHPSIHFYLYINDQDAKRVETCGNLCEYLAADANKNVSVYWADLEVNDFLRKAATTNVIPSMASIYLKIKQQLVPLPTRLKSSR